MKGALRRAPLLTAGVAVGGMSAGLLIAVSPRLAGETRIRPVQPLETLTARQNKQHLTVAQVATLRRWAERFSRCARQLSLPIGEPAISHDEILLRSTNASYLKKSELLRGLSCTARVGGPPPLASFVLSGGVLHLYRPRACLFAVHPAKK